jgi:hypothetical protein
LVASGCFSLPGRESQARAFAGGALNVTFLAKPFALEHFHHEICRLLSGAGGCGSRRPPGGW